MSSALRTRRYAGSNPVRKANHQRVGESGRPYLPWKQGIVCSNHTTLTIVASIAVMLRAGGYQPKTKQGVRALLTTP